MIEGINTHNNEFGTGISDIPVVSYQQEYEGIIGNIVFINIGPETAEVEQVIIGKSDFYKTRGEHIARIVKSQTGRILTGDRTLFFTSDSGEAQNTTCELMAEGLGIDEINIFKSRYLRTKASRYQSTINQIVDEFKVNVKSSIDAIIVLTDPKKYIRLSNVLGFDEFFRDNVEPQIKANGGINKNELYYFPFNPHYLLTYKLGNTW